jgi:hypothetical protein
MVVNGGGWWHLCENWRLLILFFEGVGDKLMSEYVSV